MNFEEYQQAAARTIPAQDKKKMITHGVMGLTSEAGEVSGLFQKEIQGHTIDPTHLKKELGDCLWMIAEIATAFGFDMAEIAQMNIEKLKKRYPDGFDTERSLHRAKGDI